MSREWFRRRRGKENSSNSGDLMGPFPVTTHSLTIILLRRYHSCHRCEFTLEETEAQWG
jgi:hypothetical protein